MADDFLKDRTFKLYYFDPKPLPDFAAESQCGGKHHNGAKVAFDFRALEFHDDGLRPTVLKFKDQNFEIVATDWERKNSAILIAGGWMPIVDEEGVVIAYFGHANPAATYNFTIVDIDGNIAHEWWDEPALQPSIPFELLGTLYGGLAGRTLAKAAIRKFAAKAIVKVKGAFNATLLKTILRKRIVRKPLPELNGRPTFIMRIEQAGPQSREAAEKLFQKAGRTDVAPDVRPMFIEYVMDTAKVLANAN